jgi:uncharacterized protein
MPLNEHAISFEVNSERLHGMLHLPTSSDAPHPCVLMLHGFTGTSIEPHRLFVLMARAFATAGIAALRFDFRGSGQSEGVFNEMTLTHELEDALSALRLLEGREDVIDRSRMGILGLSMGGLMAALTAGAVNVKALALWAPATPAVMLGHFEGERRNPAFIAGAFAAGFAGQEFPAGIRFDATSGHMDFGGNPVSKEFFMDALSHDSLETVKNHAGPALIVHGTADPTVPFAVGQQYAVALGTRATLHAIDGAGHTFESMPHHDEALRVTLEFFQRSL